MTDLVTQSSSAPTRKVSAVAAAGALVTVGTFLAGLFGIEVPAETVSALQTLTVFGAGYLVKESA